VNNEGLRVRKRREERPWIALREEAFGSKITAPHAHQRLRLERV